MCNCLFFSPSFFYSLLILLAILHDYIMAEIIATAD